MSFSSEAKAEICRNAISKKCCAVSECYGVLLFCNSFSGSGIRIITANPDFAARIVPLFRRAFGFGFDVLPAAGSSAKKSFIINDPKKLEKIFNTYGYTFGATLSHHVNLSVMEDDCCTVSFIRGAFLAGGSVTDPEKRYHLELTTSHYSVSRETLAILSDMGFSAKEASRNGNRLIYFKQADTIADFFTALGASSAALSIMTAKVDKEMRNEITRKVNCDTANADKVVATARAQIDTIHEIVGKYGLDSLPEPLKDAALLRIANPEASLADLSVLSYPKVSKSTLAYRLKRLENFRPDPEE